MTHLGQLFLYATAWVLPVLAVLLLLGLWARTRLQHRPVLPPAAAAYLEVCAWVTGVNLVMLSSTAAFDWAFFRYLTHLIPLLVAALAVAVVWVMERWPIVAYGLVAALVTTNVLYALPYAALSRVVPSPSLWVTAADSGSPGFQALDEVWERASRWRSDAWMYAQELIHAYQGPNEGLVAYLKDHALPGQTLMVNYEDLPLAFYTGLRVLGGLSGRGLSGATQPDWVVDRKHGPYREQLAALVSAGSYERIVLPYPDIRWENRPEPGSHQYLTVRNEESVVLYRRGGTSAAP